MLFLSVFLLSILLSHFSQVYAVQEELLLEKLDQDIIPFYQNRLEHGTLKGKGNITLHYARRLVANEKGALIILPGRKECARKYAELIYDLKDRGYSIYILDHRGQGASGRMLEDGSKGHVEYFDDYVVDFGRFMENVVAPGKHKKNFVVAHSMGCLIASLYAVKKPDSIDGMFFCAPMMEVRIPKYKFLVSFAVVFFDSIGLGNTAVPGKDLFSIDFPFEQNRATHSRQRYEMNKILLKRNKELFVGPPTFRWVRQGMNAGNLMRKQADALDVPVLILQAKGDEVVSAAGQNQFCKKAGKCTLKVLDGASHEILMEKDSIRNEALSYLFDFLSKYSRDSKP